MKWSHRSLLTLGVSFLRRRKGGMVYAKIFYGECDGIPPHVPSTRVLTLRRKNYCWIEEVKLYLSKTLLKLAGGGGFIPHFPPESATVKKQLKILGRTFRLTSGVSVNAISLHRAGSYGKLQGAKERKWGGTGEAWVLSRVKRPRGKDVKSLLRSRL